MARTATPEQKQKAEQRRANFRKLAAQVGAMSEDERTALVERFGTITTIEGHPLTIANAVLVLKQNAAASMVGGFRQWRNAGRQVRKGERALMIWVPRARRKSDDEQGEQDNRPRFIPGNVFDISQTDPAD